MSSNPSYCVDVVDLTSDGEEDIINVSESVSAPTTLCTVAAQRPVQQQMDAFQQHQHQQQSQIQLPLDTGPAPITFTAPPVLERSYSDQDEVLRQWEYRGAGFKNGRGDVTSLSLPLNARPHYVAAFPERKRKKVDYQQAYTVQSGLSIPVPSAAAFAAGRVVSEEEARFNAIMNQRVLNSTYTVPDVFSVAAVHPVVKFPISPSLEQNYTTSSIPTDTPSSSHLHSAVISRLNERAAMPTFYAKVTFHLLNSAEFTVRTLSLRITHPILTVLKQVPGVRFDWDKKRFVFPISEHNKLKVALSLVGLYVEALPPLTLAAITLKQNKMKSTYIEVGGEIVKESSEMVLKPLLPARLLNLLAPFQQDGVRMIMQNEGRTMLCDEMGLGKTIQAIAAAYIYRSEWPVLVICPSSVRLHWQEQILHWLDREVVEPAEIVCITSGTPLKSTEGLKFLIVSYSMMKSTQVQRELGFREFKVVICDESHYLKNSKARRTQCITPFIKSSSRALLLSGTPALSRPYELFTQLNALNSEVWPDDKAFQERYCKLNDKGKRRKNIVELHTLLTSTVMIRRLKKDVLTQILPKRRHIVRIPVVDEMKRRELQSCVDEVMLKSRYLLAARKGAVGKSSSSSSMQPLSDGRGTTQELASARRSLLMKLFYESGPAKMAALFTHLETFLDDKMSGKLLIFAHHQVTMNLLDTFLAQKQIDHIRIDGRTPLQQRHANVERFQTSTECRVAVLSISAAGIALTFTAASTVYFAELYWTPAALIQAEDRAHRIGQTSQLNVVYFLANGTVDDIIWPLICRKMKLLGEMFEGKEGDLTVDRESETLDLTSDEQEEQLNEIEEVGKELLEYEKKSEASTSGATVRLADDDDEEEDCIALGGTDSDHYEQVLGEEDNEVDMFASMYIGQVKAMMRKRQKAAAAATATAVAIAIDDNEIEPSKVLLGTPVEVSDLSAGASMPREVHYVEDDDSERFIPMFSFSGQRIGTKTRDDELGPLPNAVQSAISAVARQQMPCNPVTGFVVGKKVHVFAPPVPKK